MEAVLVIFVKRIFLSCSGGAAGLLRCAHGWSCITFFCQKRASVRFGEFFTPLSLLLLLLLLLPQPLLLLRPWRCSGEFYFPVEGVYSLRPVLVPCATIIVEGLLPCWPFLTLCYFFRYSEVPGISTCVSQAWSGSVLKHWLGKVDFVIFSII